VTNNKETKHWSELFTDEVLEVFPDEEIYTCAAGISPSGIIHFGNLRDVVTSLGVFQELKNRGKKVKIIFSWDDFDRFRKVPVGVDSSFEEYIGLPLSKVPCPDGKYSSYAEKYEKEFEESMKELNIDLEYRYQTQEYISGKYDDLIIFALQNRKKIAEILLSFMTEKGKENKNINPEKYKKNYYPISVYSSFNGKDNTKIIDYDGDKKITYKCFDTGQEETIDITKKRIVKLAWKVDWAMRWKLEKVDFEPAGKDHSSPGGSYDVSSQIIKEVFDGQPPVFEGYEFVGLQGLGGKMSGSKGNSISPKQLLEIYTPNILKWLYFRRRPKQSFSLAFDTEIYRQYNEFDKETGEFISDELEASNKVSLILAGLSEKNIFKNPIPFRQIVGFGQIIQWDKKKLLEILKELELKYDEESIDVRLPRAKNWLETYNKDELIKLNDKINKDFLKQMSNEDKVNIKKLFEGLKSKDKKTIKDIETFVYDIPKDKNLSDKENAPNQRSFFKVVYNLLIGKNKGPRLSTFLWAVDRDKVLKLLDIE